MKIAIAFIVCDRPEYFKQILDSVKAQSLPMYDTDVYLFQDNSLKEDKIKTSVDLFKDCFPNGTVHTFESNVGVAVNYHFASTYLFIENDYTHIIFIEEDLVLSKYYFETLMLLLNKFGEDERIGMIGVSGANMMNSIEKQQQHSNEITSMNNTWNFCLPKHAFLTIRPLLEEYLTNFIFNKNYRERDHVKIREWFLDNGFRGNITSQDYVKTCCLAKNNLIKITCYPGLVKHIGVVGLHNNVEAYKKYGFGEQELYDAPITDIEDLTDDKYNEMLRFSNETYLI